MSSESSPTFDVNSPFDGELIQTLAYTDEAATFAALERAHELHNERAGWLGAPQRIEILERFASLVEAQLDALAQQAAREGGKPISDSLVELVRAIDGVKVAVKEIGQLLGTEIPMRLNDASAHRFAHTYREPRGVVLAISAFNHPFNLIIHQVITAVAAGCPVLVKPALATPLSCISVVELLAEAGLPDGWCQLLLPERAVTEKIVAADIDAAIPLLTRGGFYHAGQVCVGVQRIYLQRAIAEEFTAKFVDAVGDLVSGDPLDAATVVGPLIRKREVTRVDAWVKEGVEAGAELLCGGEPLTETVYAPTVLLDPPDDARVSQEEIFGPVVALYTYDDIDEAIARANAPDLFFQASIFTTDLDTALSASRRLNGMAVMVNDHSAFRVDWMPFGGHRQSGLGTGGIGPTMRDMTLERMVVFHSKAL